MVNINMQLVTNITAVVGVIASLYFGLRTLKHRGETNKLLRASTNFDWGQMLVAADVIAKEMRRKNFSPHLILAIHGGGAIFAQLLSIQLGEEIPLTNIHILAKKDDAPSSGNLVFLRNEWAQLAPEDTKDFLLTITNKWVQFIPEYLKQDSADKKVVVVDDFCISGDSLASVRDGLKGLGFARDNIKTVAPLATRQAINAANPPDFWWIVVNTDAVNFPWGPGQKRQRMGLAPQR